jgi:imidazolonepropionase-like amidohydrolase
LKRLFYFVLLSATVCLPVTTQEASSQTIVLTADRMLDIDSGGIVSPATIVIDDGRITAVNPARTPPGAEMIALGDVTLLPGLIDMHTHLTVDLEGDWVNRPVKESAADAALRGVEYARRTLAAGFTTVRDLGSGGFADVALAKAVNEGRIEGPDIFPAAHALGITGGHCDYTGFSPGVVESGPEGGIADGTDELLTAVRYQIKHGAKVIKFCATAGVLSFEGPVGAQQFSDEEMRVIVDEAKRHGLKVAAHAHGSEGILAAVLAGVSSIDHGSMLTPEINRAMIEHGTYLVPTSYLGDAIDFEQLPPPIRAKAEFVIPLARKSLANAIADGVKIAFGTDAGVFPHGDNAREFAVLVKQGMTPADAIRTATTNAADLLGRTDRGKIAPGLRADIIAVPGNPLQDITVLERVSFVMKEGSKVRMGE